MALSVAARPVAQTISKVVHLVSKSKKSLKSPLRISAAAASPAHSLQSRRSKATGTFAALSPPPFETVIVYNQSKHATQSVLADIRAVWGNKVRVLQTLEDGKQRLPGMDGVVYVKPKTWGDLEHFKERLDSLCTRDHGLHQERAGKQICFMPGWSAFAESSEAARAVDALGLVWPGTEPVASQTLEKIGFKRICSDVGAPTPPFVVLSEEDAGIDLTDPAAKEKLVTGFMKMAAGMKTNEPGLIKSIHGGGGKGTAPLDDPSDPEQVRASVEKVLVEMNRSDGIYFEQKVNTKGDGRFYQLELEVDGETCAQGGRFVWFNSRLQKVVEIGLSDDLVSMFMPLDLYQKSRQWAVDIAKKGGNNTRATMEGLVFQNEKGEFELQFIECNRRPQVENEALALLQEDSAGNRRYTFAELMMRASGVPAPTFDSAKNCSVVLHARWLHGNPDSDGNIAYQAGNIMGMNGPRLDYVAAELMAPGEISFTSDPQLGKTVITANSWDEMCDRAAEYFKLRTPAVMGSSSTYAQVMYNLFTSPDFRKGKTASNETFKKLDIPEHPSRGVANILQDQVSPILVKGYRPGEGIDAKRFPTSRVSGNVQRLQAELSTMPPRETAFSKFARGLATYEEYIQELRSILARQGGAWVTVAPRDTAQQGNDSESATVTSLSRQNAEIWAEKSGCVGYEIGGAQYQAGLIRGFDPAMILRLGLPYNMPGHSLQRSQYANGLAELPTSIRQPLFDATAEVVANHYQPGLGVGDKWVPWQPYNFHAGNFHDDATGYSPQDETTAELLKSKCVPMPNWVFSPKFPLEALKKWTGRQIDIFSSHGLPLHQVRIKNPGQGVDWTATAIWSHVKTIASVFKERGIEPPIVYLHNHDFNGSGAHIAAEAFRTAQAEGFNTLVIDAAYRKNGTHNDNTVLTAPLNLSPDQKDALIEYNYNQQQIEEILCRFDSRTSQMTPWDSDWAGGTEGSDIRIAKEFGLDVMKINHAKEVANEVFPLERAVTPFSEYKLRLGIAIMIEPSIEPKTADAVRKWVNSGGKLKVGGDVLVGLKRWETLVPKTSEADKLLENMSDELASALAAKSSLIGPQDVPSTFTAGQRHTALGYQQKGLDFAASQAKGTDLSPLLLAPHLVHARPKSLEPGVKFDLLTDPENPDNRHQVEFKGFGTAANSDITLTFEHEGKTMQVTMPDPDAVSGSVVASGPRKAEPGNRLHFPTVVPGEILTYSVQVGDKLKVGQPLCVLESMKMEMKISVPSELDGFEVQSLPCKGRTKETQGDILAPGDLLLELRETN